MGYKFSNILIGMVLISLFIGVYVLFLADLNTQFPQPTYNDSRIQFYNKLSNVTALALEVDNSTSGVTTQTSGLFDILGSFFSGGYTTLKILKDSYDTIIIIVVEGLKELNLGAAAALFRQAFLTIILIIIVVGIIVSTLVKRET